MPHTPGIGRALETRASVLRAIRAHFHAGGFLEVDTPVRVATPCLELHIDAEPSGERFLRTSPELHMKRLLAAGHDRIFQVGPCFRRGERGDLHHPEYTMLEWYRADADYRDMMEDTRELLRHVVREIRGEEAVCYRGQTITLAGDWAVLPVARAFREHAGWDPVAAFDADRFDHDLVTKVEPALPADRPVVLTDYPAELAALARLKRADPAIAERWELYIGGLELANAYSELTDPVEQRARFARWAALRRAAGRETYPVDEDFMASLEAGLPACGGIALGIDRLVMLLCDAASLDEVMPFR